MVYGDSTIQSCANMSLLPHQIRSVIEDHGTKALLFGGKSTNSLSSLRYNLFRKRIITDKSFITPEHLPSTESSTKYHCQRVYLQIMVWIGKEGDINTGGWGWKLVDNQFLRLRLLPQKVDLLQMIHCKCTTACQTQRCSCRAYGLPCMSACGPCQDEKCENHYNQPLWEEECDNWTVCGGPSFNDDSKPLPDAQSIFKRLSSWADTQKSVHRVLKHLEFKQFTDDALLSDSVGKKFQDFHRDMTEECGVEDKQHSWGVIEKQEEIVMYGPYYPNYNHGLHSEDTIIKQTEELLESGEVSGDWKVYIFTMNSPCLARNTEPCMLKLVQKAQLWWSQYGVKTYIGYAKCWGFKGPKESLFRDINCNQVDCINQTEDYGSYLKASEEKTDLSPLCDNVFSAIKHLLKSEFCPFMNMEQEQDWRSYFRSMQSISEGKPELVKEILKQEVIFVIEATKTLFTTTSGSFAEHLDNGQAFASDYIFSSQISNTVQDEMRHTFQECWREMMQDKCTEFIKEKLTEEFNQCTVQLFIKDIKTVSEEFLQIGQIQPQSKCPITEL
ncbi:uncharacterized protein LOC117824494 [Xyrichtys novacula]|uniref:Uncharacterized protein LOC117824494 n=1 Tax=Xyrichtys novacula TaxID=13765 RepID=A0AAV1GXG6_XYRNO|nr:uncharacterized protein LOC117824494 [Xyrichtys novacula]